MNPFDKFGKMMITNLRDRGCPLLCAHEYPDLGSITTRLKRFGFDEISAENMHEIYTEQLDAVDRLRVEQLELFDELEEYRLIQEHYYCAICLKQSSTSQQYYPLTSMTNFWVKNLDASTTSERHQPRFSTDEFTSHAQLLEKTALSMLAASGNLRHQHGGRFISMDVSTLRAWIDKQNRPHLGPALYGPNGRLGEQDGVWRQRDGVWRQGDGVRRRPLPTLYDDEDDSMGGASQRMKAQVSAPTFASVMEHDTPTVQAGNIQLKVPPNATLSDILRQPLHS